MGDFNGDGRDDIAYYGRCDSAAVKCWRVQHGTGTGFAAPHDYGDFAVSDETFRFGFHTGDFNGDGRDDIVSRSRCGHTHHPCWQVLASQPGDTFAEQDWGNGFYMWPFETTPTGC